MNLSSEQKEKDLKSQRANELEAIRMKGLAKERRTWLNDLVNSPLTTPEEAARFLAVMKDKSRKQEYERNQATTPTRPEAFMWADGGVDSWFMQQRYREKELRMRREEAAQLLHGYKGYFPDKDSESFDWCSPRNSMTPKARSSFGGERWGSESKNKDKSRRLTSFARLETTNNFGAEDDARDESFLPNPLAPDRSKFLNVQLSYDGTGYPKPNDRSAYHDGHTLFNEHGFDPNNVEAAEGGREPGVTYTPFSHMSVEASNLPMRASDDGFNTFDDVRDEGSSLDEISLEALRQRRYDSLFQKTPAGRDANIRDFGSSDLTLGDSSDNRQEIVEGKVRQRIKDSEAQKAELLEKGFAEKESGRNIANLRLMPLSIGTEASPPVVPETIWRNFISDEPGAKFPPEAGRYHLYASYACPGSHRALIVRALKGLEDVISVTIVHPTWRHTNLEDSSDKHRGWVFGDPNGKPFRNTTGRGGPFPPAYQGNEPDPIFGASSIRELYEYAQDTSGKYTIPLLWDKKLNTIVNNESSDISYMMNSSFNDFSKESELDLYTEDDEEGLNKLNEVSQWLYPMMIHGVYRCGFAKTQKAYDSAITQLTTAFDMAEELLGKQRYLTGDTLTDADLRLFVTLLRFDEVYAFYFRANTRLVMMSPTLLGFCREIYQMKGVAETCQMDQIKAHFYGSHAEWNKYSVIPRGLGFMKLLETPHTRDDKDHILRNRTGSF